MQLSSAPVLDFPLQLALLIQENALKMDAPKPVYGDLLRLVQDKDYFVLTTNVDHCFQKAGFDKHRLFYTGRL